MTAASDWYAWHALYDELDSPLARRLAVVQDRVRGFLDAAPPGPLRVLSLAAGQSRELLPMLIEHPRGRDVRARLVELDPRNADFAEGAALGAGLADVEVVVSDAGLIDSFAGAAPADAVLACGLFELLDDADADMTIAGLPQLCKAGGLVVWTMKGGAESVAVTRIREHLAASGFRTGVVTTLTDGAGEHVVADSRLDAQPATLVPGTRLFHLR
jgi:hypothetical protein